MKQLIVKTVAKHALTVKKNSPTVLFVAGIASVATSTILACRATLKLEDVLDETDLLKDKARLTREERPQDYSNRDYTRDIAILQTKSVLNVAKLYAPAIGVGFVGVACLTKSHNILSGRNAALTAAYAGLEKTYRKYREIVADEVGEDKERELHYTAQKDVARAEQARVDSKKNGVNHGGSQYARFFDQLSSNWNKTAEYNLLFLRCQQQYMNDLLQTRGHVFLNDVYDALDIPRSRAGAVVGWTISKEGDNFVDFGIFTNDSQEVRNFVNGYEDAILLDFNVDGVIYDKI